MKPIRGREPGVNYEDNIHRILKRLFDEMRRQQCGVKDMAVRAGVSSTSIFHWSRRFVDNRAGGLRRPNAAKLENVEACLNVLGLTLYVGQLKDKSDETID
jgi:hypothetical protein